MRLCVFASMMFLLLLLPAASVGSAANRAGVVIRYADGTVRSSCVSFEEQSISGLELLQRSEAEVIAQVAPGNAAICKIDADGCDYPAEPCFCEFGAGNSGAYWAYWQLDGGAWRYGQQGAGARRVSNGDVDGWAFGAGSVENGVQPPPTTFAELCPLASTAQPATSAALASTAAPSIARSAPAPSALASTSRGAGPGQSDGGRGSYAVFGAMLAIILGAIALAVRRRGAA